MPRKAITEFALANPIYAAATVDFWTVSGGVKTGTHATLYTAPTGTDEHDNPLTLDSEGKTPGPVYIDVPVIATVDGLTVGTHDTGIIYPEPTFRVEQSTGKLQYSYDGLTWNDTGDYVFRARGNWLTATEYARNDTAANAGILYLCVVGHTSGTFATDLAAGKWIALVNATAAQISNTPAGGVAATDVQAAINELDSEKVAKTGDTMSGDLVFSAGVIQANKGADITAAATTDLGTATGGSVTVTHAAGTLAITSLGGATDFQAGTEIETVFSISGGTLSLTHHATNLILAGGATITLTNGDTIRWRKMHDTNAEWKMVGGVKADGTAWVSGIPQTVQTFTSSGTWNKPAGVKFVVVELVGGGGGGGGGQSGGNMSGGGGGGGGYSRKLILAASLGASETVTIGAAGNGGAAGNNGTSGGTTSFGTHCSATGGANGVAAGNGGQGGIGSSGTFNTRGQSGSTGIFVSASTQGGGTGGGSFFGGGGTGSQAGGAYGGGGGGGAGSGAAGGGASGLVVVTEFY